MEYHEIGEIFECDGVKLKVAFALHCDLCYFRSQPRCANMHCLGTERRDRKFIHYKLV